MILSLYTLHAPRRNIDYSLMKLSNDMKDDKFNYLDMDKKQFIFNSYKTQQKYRPVVVPIEDESNLIISKYSLWKSKLKNKKYDVHFLKLSIMKILKVKKWLEF